MQRRDVSTLVNTEAMQMPVFPSMQTANGGICTNAGFAGYLPLRTAGTRANLTKGPKRPILSVLSQPPGAALLKIGLTNQ